MCPIGRHGKHAHCAHRPFDPELYEDEGEDDDVLDEEGRARLKLKVRSCSKAMLGTYMQQGHARLKLKVHTCSKAVLESN